MEYKKNKKKFDLQFKKKVALKACANKRKLEEEKAPDVWNERREEMGQAILSSRL